MWIYDLSGATAMRRLTLGSRNRVPVWSADGEHVAFQSERESDLAIWWQRADGTTPAEGLTKPDKDTANVPESWSPDGWRTRLISPERPVGSCSSSRFRRLGRRMRSRKVWAPIPRGLPMGRSCSTLRQALNSLR